MPSPLSAFLSELKRRRVFRVAAFYGGIAFVIIQIIDGTFALMGVPEWVGRMMVVLLILGFPISMILAWIFDITEEGIVRAKGRPVDAKRKAVPLVGNKALAFIAAVAILVAAWSWFDIGNKSPEIRSIAVLPLENLMHDSEQDYFVDGMHEALTAELSKISALRVIGRTSTMSYKGTTKTLPEIAKELGVDALIEGSVLLVGNEVRITAQLVATRPERHLWVNDYERSMENVLVLHKEVAQAIAREIKVTLTQKEATHLETEPTVSPEAYQAFLRGRYFSRLPHFDIENWNLVLKSFQQAVDLDPNFALAYAELSRAHSRMRYTKADLSQERLDKAKEAADRALELASDSPEVHRILSYYYMWAYHDADQAFRELELAKAGLPDDAEYYKAKGYFNFYLLGRMEEAREAFETAFALSPRDASIPTELGFLFGVIRDFPRAIDAGNQAIELAPDEYWPYVNNAAMYWTLGNLEAARVALEAAPPMDEHLFTLMWLMQELYEGQFQKVLDRSLAFPHEMLKTKMYAYPRSWFVAAGYQYLGEIKLASRYANDAIMLLESEVQQSPEDPRLHSTLGVVYAAMHRKDEAIYEGQKAVELLPISKDAFYGQYPAMDLALIYTISGEDDLAMDQLEYLLSIPSNVTIASLQLDSRYASLWELPRFKALVQKYGESG